MAKAARRSYAPEDRAAALAALAANGGNFKRTSAETGVPRPTLQLWAAQAARAASGIVPEVPLAPKPLPPTAPDPAQVDAARRSLAARFEDFVGRVLDLTTDDDVRAAPLHRRFTAAGIAVDKMRLLRGEPAPCADARLVIDVRAYLRLGPDEQAAVFREALAGRVLLRDEPGGQG